MKENAEIPYITVEIDDTRIIQWYGMNDKKPDKENMDRWLDDYVKHLKEKKVLAAVRTAQEEKMIGEILNINNEYKHYKEYKTAVDEELKRSAESFVRATAF